MERGRGGLKGRKGTGRGREVAGDRREMLMEKEREINGG